MNINGKDVLNMNHQKVVSVLKSCPNGAVCSFIVRRDIPQEVAMQHKGMYCIFLLQCKYETRYNRSSQTGAPWRLLKSAPVWELPRF